jgi:Zn-dependent protease/predicted transcriptional regulator
MNSSLPLGSIRGIRIGVNWSLVVVFALIVWTLADAIFPSENPGLADTVYLAMAIVAAILFFASILAHELGHAFVAQHEGMEIEGITLWLFGGVAKFRGEFPSAGGEFRIAIAGPIVSAVIGGVCVGLAQLGLPDAVDGVAAWLGYINLLLLGFNLLPALPLDGGRVLRAALWRAKGSYIWATRVAASVGQAFGLAMVVGGIVMLVVESAFSGAWLAFIGWFLWTAAGEERRYAERRAAFDDLHVEDVMARDAILVDRDTTLAVFMNDVYAPTRRPTYPVVENGTAIGLVTAGRVATVPPDQWTEHTVAEEMIALDELPRLRADQSLASAAARLAETNAEAGVVAEGDQVLGVLALADVVETLRRTRNGR